MLFYTLFRLAFLTAASIGCDEFVEIFLTVIISQFFSRRDILFGMDDYPSSILERFAIGTTRMIDIAGRILPGGPIDREARVDPEKIFSAFLVGFGIVEIFTGILDDEIAPFEMVFGEESQSS